ncbi:uncharacterized protein Z519_05198 [Cladophialophora bantiana CBS 173.52]|uniref:Uncharacterized protein n=1 Tax=Cladophialophora bantiana (strain ATCC 10958 / CBS 173.52 / CDC B-1940 / NIH 8579) TaxID=1442370 RepID=A0A0D2HKS7_CLAB1|nr:uncharacterized protein Z519_05198 [Cladophialophora bantiana CBS 173.52]KIW93883.1 hypothetical protein Z519_05198 [Cladophialophora bantiana CBS 173.52]
MFSRRRKSRHYRRCEVCPNWVAGTEIFQQLVQQNTDQATQLGNLQARNATLEKELSNANNQVDALILRLANTEKAATKSQHEHERLAHGEQCKEAEKAIADLQTENEKFRLKLNAEMGKTLEVDTKLETRITDLINKNKWLERRCEHLETVIAWLKQVLEGDKALLMSQCEALEAIIGQPKDQNEVHKEDSARSRGQNRALEGVKAELKARISELEKVLNESGEEPLMAQQERNRLQETARNGGTTEPAIPFRNITPPTTPPKTTKPTMPGDFPLDDNPQPDEQVIPQESAKKDVRRSSPTPQMETASQSYTPSRRNYFSRFS